MARQEIIGTFEGRRIARMLHQLYLGTMARDERFVVTGWQDDGWVTVQFRLESAERTYPVEARIHTKPQGIRPQQAKELLLDLLGHFFGLYLSDGRAPFTGPKWEKVSMADTEVFVRGQERHEAAEAEASALLAADAERAAAAIARRDEAPSGEAREADLEGERER